MLDWLKEIIGDDYTEDIDKKVSKELGEKFVARKDFNEVNEAKKQLETDITKRDDDIKALEKTIEEADTENLKGTIDDLKTQLADQKEVNTTTKTEYETKIADMQFDGIVDTALSGAKVKDVTAAKALLDIGSLKESKNQSEDIKSAIDKLKEDKGFLFDSDEPIDKPIVGRTGGGGTGGSESDAAMRAVMGLDAQEGDK